MNTEHILNGFNRTITLYKQGEEVASFANTKSMPTFNQQAKWKFSKGENFVHLHNPVDDVVYHFATPEGLADTGVSAAHRSADLKGEEFHKEKAVNAQVHRSDPGSVYFTVQDGKHNPTFTLKHVGGQKWHFEAKKQKAKAEREIIHQTPFEQHKEAILKQALEGSDAPWYDPVPYVAKGLTETIKGVGHIGDNPWMSAGLAGAGGLAYDQAKRHLYNTEAENEAETAGERIRRVALPAGAAGLLGTILHTGLPNYYKQ